MGREAFLKRVWEWKAESGGTIINQLKRLGCSCDWSRERFTMDEGLSRAVLKVFVELHQAGLIYKDKRLVNWDPKLLTAISDLEVQPDRDQGPSVVFQIPDQECRAAEEANTSWWPPRGRRRCSAIPPWRCNPNDKRWKTYVGKMVVLPLVGREIPIVADEYADPEQGSGAVKITPAHDFNDFEVGRRHDLEMINIFDAHARLNENVPEAYRGLDRFEARKRVVADLEALGLVEKIEPHVHKVPYGDRSGVVIEPYLTDQWYVDAKTLAEARHRGGGATGAPCSCPRNWDEDLLRVDAQHRAVVHFAPALVGASDPGVVWPGWRNVRRAMMKRKRRRRRPRRALRQDKVSTLHRAIPTCSTRGFPPRCGRSPRSAGRTKRRS